MYAGKLKVFPEPTVEDAEVLLMYGVDKESRPEVIKTLKEWVISQPHLPNDIDESRCLNTYMWSKKSLQRAKDALDMYFTLRTAIPELYADRDPKSEWFERITTLGCYLPMPRLTEKYERICIIRALTNDTTHLDAIDAAKMGFMVVDIRMMYDCPAGDIFIIDYNNVTPQLVARFTPSLLKKVEVLGFKAFCLKIRGIHFVNAPSYAEFFVSLLKAVITKPKIRDRIHVHSKGMDSLHAFIDKKYLPEEYGGDAGPLQQYWDGWKKTLMDFRDWFVEQENVKADESKREKPLTSNDLFGFEGSFRQLSVD